MHHERNTNPYHDRASRSHNQILLNAKNQKQLLFRVLVLQWRNSHVAVTEKSFFR
jgi:hypothetical protein